MNCGLFPDCATVCGARLQPFVDADETTSVEFDASPIQADVEAIRNAADCDELIAPLEFAHARGGAEADRDSRYFVRPIADTGNIALHVETEIRSLEGEQHLERVTWKTRGGELGSRAI